MHLKIVVTAAALLAGAGQVWAQAPFSAQDKMFLRNAAQDNMAEIAMAKLALSKSSNTDIHDYAQKMVTDHQALIDGAKPVNEKAGVTSPSGLNATQMAEIRKLTALSGTAFDKTYVRDNVKDHHMVLAQVKNEANTTRNDDMKTLASHAADVVAQHTDMIDGIAQKMGLSRPQQAASGM